MKPGIFNVNYEEERLSASIAVKPSLASAIFLYALNIMLISIIILFTIGGIGIIVLFIVAFEVLFLRYSIWNLYGSEIVTLKGDRLTYQLHYSAIKLPLRSRTIHQSIRVIPFHDNFQTANTAVKLIFESTDEDNDPVNLYQTTLLISREDYQRFMMCFNQYRAALKKPS
jgi:hypothetical protein